MSNFLNETYQPLLGTVLGLGMLLWPPPRRKVIEEKRAKRLAELDAGAAEAFFEERRELEAYGPASAGPFRLLGAVVLLLSLGSVWFILAE